MNLHSSHMHSCSYLLILHPFLLLLIPLMPLFDQAFVVFISHTIRATLFSNSNSFLVHPRFEWIQSFMMFNHIQLSIQDRIQTNNTLIVILSHRVPILTTNELFQPYTSAQPITLVHRKLIITNYNNFITFCLIRPILPLNDVILVIFVISRIRTFITCNNR